jgi:dihydrofolate reductase
MGKLVLQIFITVDGAVDGEGRAALMSWNPRFFSDEFSKQVRDQLLASDALLLGRKTFERFAAAWPSRQPSASRSNWSVDEEIADRINSLPKHVASRRLNGSLPWNGSLIQGDVSEEVSRIKQRTARDILLYGGGELAHLLMERKLVDEYHLLVFPVLVGAGKRFFPDDADSTLSLVESKPVANGLVSLRYQVSH